MPPFPALTTLAAVLATASASSITFQNAGSQNICYMVETSSGTFPSTTTCGLGNGIPLNTGETTTVDLGASFNGALTAWTNNIRGARYEVNFAATAGSTWYDTDYQLGMSDGTLGPSDNQTLADGRSSLSGERDTLAKANAAWPSTPNQAALLTYPDYLRQGPGGALTFVYCDSGAPQAVVDFFQVTAAFRAYVDAGSVAGEAAGAGEDAEAVKLADEMSWVVGTQDMLIVAY